MNISDERSVNSKQASCGVYCVTGSSRKVKDLGCLLCYDQLSTITSRLITKLVLSCRFTAPYQCLFSSIKLAKLCSSGQEPSKNHQVKVPKKKLHFFLFAASKPLRPVVCKCGWNFSPLFSFHSLLSFFFKVLVSTTPSVWGQSRVWLKQGVTFWLPWRRLPGDDVPPSQPVG